MGGNVKEMLTIFNESILRALRITDAKDKLFWGTSMEALNPVEGTVCWNH